MEPTLDPVRQGILNAYAKLKSCGTISTEFDVQLNPYTEAAKRLLGKDPHDTLSNASEEELQELSSRIDLFAKAAVSKLCRSQINYYQKEFLSRLDAIPEKSNLEPLAESVTKKCREALDYFDYQKSRSFDEFWKTSNQSVQFVLCAANLVSRHGALFTIATQLEKKNEEKDLGLEKIEDLLRRAKKELKIDSPGDVLKVEEIDEIQQRFLNEVNQL